MNPKWRIILPVLLALLLLLAAGAVVLAQTSEHFDATWHVLSSGGGASGSASYRVYGVVGQNAAGPPAASSSSFSVTGGFLVPAEQRRIYLPAVLKG